jgi:hypothetical protein
MVSHDLQHQYMDQVTAESGSVRFLCQHRIYGHQDFSYAQLARADALAEMGGIVEGSTVWRESTGAAAMPSAARYA